jgi:hypothetical protein
MYVERQNVQSLLWHFLTFAAGGCQQGPDELDIFRNVSTFWHPKSCNWTLERGSIDDLATNRSQIVCIGSFAGSVFRYLPYVTSGNVYIEEVSEYFLQDCRIPNCLK